MAATGSNVPEAVDRSAATAKWTKGKFQGPVGMSALLAITAMVDCHDAMI